MPLSSRAKGQILVHEAIKLLWLGSDGRLCPYEPVADIEGLDLLVKVQGDPAAVGLQPKGDFELDEDGNVRASVQVRTFRPSPFTYVVVFDFRAEALSLGPLLWILRADVFARTVPKSSGNFHFRASPRPKARRDKYAPFRYRPIELAPVVETALAQIRGEGLFQPLPSTRRDVLDVRRRLRLRE